MLRFAHRQVYAPGNNSARSPARSPGVPSVSISVLPNDPLMTGYWVQPWQSSSYCVCVCVCVCVMCVICVYVCHTGSSLLATSTAVLGMCFLALMINTTRMTVWRITQRRAQASRTQDTNDTDTCDITPVRGSNSSIREGHKGGTSAAAQRVLDEVGCDTHTHTHTHVAQQFGSTHVRYRVRRLQCRVCVRVCVYVCVCVCVFCVCVCVCVQEARVFSMVHMLLSHCVVTLVPLIAGLVALVYRALSGRRLASTALTATCLWCGMLLVRAARHAHTHTHTHHADKTHDPSRNSCECTCVCVSHDRVSYV